MSSKMIFVGRNAHCWWYRLDQYRFPICRKEFDFNMGSILYYAHARTSTKEHDRIFALANIFPDIMKQITIDYKQDIQELIIQFYGLLAKKDLSIMCFGQYTYEGYLSICKTACSNSINDSSTKKARYTIPIQKYDLPSWTGVHGQHWKNDMYKTPFENYTVIGRALQLTCTGVTNEQHKNEISDLDSIATKDIIPPLPQPSNDYFWTLVISIQLPGSRNEKLIEVYTAWDEPTELGSKDYKKIISELCNLSCFFQIKKKNFQWIPNNDEIKRSKFGFRDMVESLENSHQYVLLNGVPFTSSNDDDEFIYYPVIKKNGEYYKAIGLCWTKDGEHFFDDITLEEQLFEIH
ncbi:hypothetical protein INT45_012323 [Circinella minor]|uniref:Uncharacterized protein n=1 Tax=Circinella minor TaxID=1195481 RepID=A0A8H7S5C9_9FUNG|nr:hypothetical protein INT45_012323 [Circinella minor]